MPTFSNNSNDRALYYSSVHNSSESMNAYDSVHSSPEHIYEDIDSVEN